MAFYPIPPPSPVNPTLGQFGVTLAGLRKLLANNKRLPYRQIQRLAPNASPYAGHPVFGANTPGGDEEKARQIAASLLDPQVAAINRAADVKARSIVANSEAAKGVLAALQKMQTGIPDSIRASYQQAADAQNRYAQGITGAVGEAAQGAAQTADQSLSSFGLPDVTSVAPAAQQVQQYLGGYLPSTDLAAAGASRFAEAVQSEQSGNIALTQQVLQQMNASQQEVDQLRQQGLDLERTRPGEIQKALLDIRDQNRQDATLALNQQQQAFNEKLQTRQQGFDERQANAKLALDEKNFKLQANAAGMQEDQINRAWYATLQDEAFNRTNVTGTLWVVKGNKVVNTGQPAPGSAAGRSATQANVKLAQEQARNARAQASLSERRAHDLVNEGIQNARVDISQQQADIAQEREARLSKAPKQGGYSSAERKDFARTAFLTARDDFYGSPAVLDKDNNVKTAAIPKREASQTLKDLLAAGVPYSIAYTAIRRYASMKGSRWGYAVDWQSTWPPKKTKKG